MDMRRCEGARVLLIFMKVVSRDEELLSKTFKNIRDEKHALTLLSPVAKSHQGRHLHSCSALRKLASR